MRLALPLLALPLLAVLLLPACRTVQTVAPASSVEAALSQTHGRSVALRFTDGRAVHPASLAVRDSFVVFTLPGSETGFTRPLREVAEVVRNDTPAASGLFGYLIIGLSPAAAQATYISVIPRARLSFDGYMYAGLVGAALGLAVNYAVNPRRERVLYRADVPRER